MSKRHCVVRCVDAGVSWKSKCEKFVWLKGGGVVRDQPIGIAGIISARGVLKTSQTSKFFIATSTITSNLSLVNHHYGLLITSAMSLFTLTRRAAMAVRPATFSFVRLNSTKAVSNASINATKLLTSISADGKTVNADEDAKKWIEAIHELRNEFTRGGTVSFNPSKAFSPDGESEINLLLASHQVNQRTTNLWPLPNRLPKQRH